MTQGNNIYIAAIHRHCIGAGLDLSSACDLRLASKDATFSSGKQRSPLSPIWQSEPSPHVIGQGNTRMLALTGRDFPATEALRMGLINELYENQEELMKGL